MMVFDHDFNQFPELTTKQLNELRYVSPHFQITEDFSATVVKVHDGDTVRLKIPQRDFDFPMRFLHINAPEMNEGGEVARDWLKDRILGAEVQIKLDPNNRVDKYGRLLGRIVHRGMDIGEEEIYLGLATPFAQRTEGKLMDMDKELSIHKWL